MLCQWCNSASVNVWEGEREGGEGGRGEAEREEAEREGGRREGSHPFLF